MNQSKKIGIESNLLRTTIEKYFIYLDYSY
jgi:hypothetical protein